MKFLNRTLVHGALLACLFIGSNAYVLADGSAHHHDSAVPATSYRAASSGTQELVSGPVSIKMLLDASNLGSEEIEVGELNLPAGYDGGPNSAHAHDSLEIFYVVEGWLGHEVNGIEHILKPGDLGFVKPGDKIRHWVPSDVPLKALVIWLPGGEAGRLLEHAGFKAQPVK
ncbi:MAG: quercetin dioxygenase-like cupin family protein [Gammaproteobacteria bacterium]|jgi:quercetin dioxygenase-like cupin family protein